MLDSLSADLVGPSFIGPIHEIAADISKYQQQLSTLSRYHRLRPLCAYLLAEHLLERYQLLKQKDDVDKSILYFTESLLSSPLSWPAHGPMILEVLSSLALALYNRSRVSKEPEVAIYAAKYFRYLRGPAHTPITFQCQRTTALLVETLELQLELKTSDVVQTLEEMTALTQELLTSDPSSRYTTCAGTCFSRAVRHKLPELPTDRLLNEIIECLRLARVHKPELRVVHFILVQCLCARIDHAMNDELDEAVSILDEIIASSFPGDEILLPICQEYMAFLVMLRSLIDGHVENSEEAIYRARAFLASSSAGDPLYPTWTEILEHGAKKRFENFGLIDGFEASYASSSSDPLAALLPPQEPADVAQGTKTRSLDEVLDGIRNDSIPAIEEAIKSRRSIIASTDPSDLESSHEFGQMLSEAYKCTENIEYLNESIDTFRQILAGRPPKLLRMSVTTWQLESLEIRSKVSLGHRLQDQHEIVELYPQILGDATQFLGLPYRLNAASRWALFARHIEHPSASTAYETAMSLMQDIAPFSPTLQLQHTTLTTLSGDSHEMPLDYASYQVEQGQLEQAIETLERGRALLWSEMRHHRTPINQLLKVDPDLGDKFAAVNRDLEELTKSIAPSHKLNMDDIVADDLRAGDQFGTLLLRQRGLLKERDKLISQIRTLPGFDRFLTFPLFDTLRSAATSGPVIIINHSECAQILILLHNASPSLIITPDDFYDRAITLKDRLLTARANFGLDSSEYDEALTYVLMELYELVGKPVISRLHELQVQEESRIWWCPTSVFCSLPLHAMGPIPSDDGEMLYFLDLYICSYTPSLSALIQSRSSDSGSRSSDRPSILLVADPSLPTVGGEIKVVQAHEDTKITVTGLISKDATAERVIDGFRRNQFIHFACHGTLVAGKPFETGFELYDKRLTLLDIVRADLPTAEFAFLSACHTAEMTEGSIMDEGLHLAAAVQYCGLRSVVGTMWAMADQDGRDLADSFYKALFSNPRQDQGIPYHERSAKALRSAVRKLRRKRGITLERWVNFVHYGA